MARLAHIVLVWCLLASPAFAHDVMGTVIYVDLGMTRVHFDVELPLDELSKALGKRVQPGVVPLPASSSAIAAYVLDHLTVSTPAGAAFELTSRAGDVILHDARNWQRVEVDALPPAGASPRDFVLHTDIIDHRVVSHHVFVFLRRDLAGGLLGAPEYLTTLHYQIHDARITRDGGSWWRGFRSVFALGSAHIAEGSDHLLFLFTLLLPAGLAVDARRRWSRRRSPREALLDVVRIVSAFTLGHSLTLLLGALGIAKLPSALVESLIAASILVSATHAVVPLFPRREAWIALAFGLVHGLGFASALEGMGVDGSTLLLTVLGFNLGVEAMQAGLVLVTLPWLFVLQRTRAGSWLRPIGAACAFVLALAWLGERALGVQTPLLALADSLFHHGAWLIAALALAALLAHRFDRTTTA